MLNYLTYRFWSALAALTPWRWIRHSRIATAIYANEYWWAEVNCNPYWAATVTMFPGGLDMELAAREQEVERG